MEGLTKTCPNYATCSSYTIYISIVIYAPACYTSIILYYIAIELLYLTYYAQYYVYKLVSHFYQFDINTIYHKSFVFIATDHFIKM